MSLSMGISGEDIAMGGMGGGVPSNAMEWFEQEVDRETIELHESVSKLSTADRRAPICLPARRGCGSGSEAVRYIDPRILQQSPSIPGTSSTSGTLSSVENGTTLSASTVPPTSYVDSLSAAISSTSCSSSSTTTTTTTTSSSPSSSSSSSSPPSSSSAAASTSTSTNPTTTASSSHTTSTTLARRRRALSPAQLDENNPEKCNMCPYTCRRRCTLTKHMLTHTRPVKCDWDGCKWAFPNSNMLERHRKNVHLGLRVKCEICGHKSRDKPNLNKHMETHGVEYVKSKEYKHEGNRPSRVRGAKKAKDPNAPPKKRGRPPGGSSRRRGGGGGGGAGVVPRHGA